MIRVNLLGELSAKPAVSGLDVKEADKNAAKKILILFVVPIGLYFYEGYHVDSMREDQVIFKKQLDKANKRLQEKQVVAQGAKKMQKQILGIENRIEVIKKLSKSRLREIKAFDTLQTIIPEKVWITSLKYENQKMEIIGGAVDDQVLQSFLVAMQERPYFDNVLLKKAANKKIDNGTVKEFFIDCTVEDVD